MSKKKKVATAFSLDSEIDKDIIDLPKEPDATTNVVPYEKGEDLVGKGIHLLYELEDDAGDPSFRFYKGVIGKKLGAGTYRFDFADGTSNSCSRNHQCPRTSITCSDTLVCLVRQVTRKPSTFSIPRMLSYGTKRETSRGEDAGRRRRKTILRRPRVQSLWAP